MSHVKSAAFGFGAALALLVGLRLDGTGLVFSVGMVMGMVAMLPLTGVLFLLLVGLFPARRVVLDGTASEADARALRRPQPQELEQAPHLRWAWSPQPERQGEVETPYDDWSLQGEEPLTVTS